MPLQVESDDKNPTDGSILRANTFSETKHEISHFEIKTNFPFREFSFTLADDVYIRYMSFQDEEDWEETVIGRVPHKIDIGAIYNFRPKDNRMASAGQFQPQEKELVFDIDMTDYDEVRTCCSGADICSKCWKFMVVATKVLDIALRNDFGFQHILWVYSGRRGVHCWVADEIALKMSVTARAAVAEYLQLLRGGANQNKKISLNSLRLHPFVARSISICEKHFKTIILDEQCLLEDNQTWEKLLCYFPDDWQNKEVLKQEASNLDGHGRWELVEEYCKEIEKKRPQLHIREEIILHCLYPRLDINVSKGLNHLLKSPFCVHPKTGRVCVPFEPHRVEFFDPEKVPTLKVLVDQCTNIEMTTYEGKNKKQRTRKDHKKTALRPSVDILDNFVEKLSKQWKTRLIEQSGKT
ncbi:hypothetical protein QYM36_002321 [Artemia franciscana]|uniref:DNA primase n=1 Tax=Artemia franciscana TaxID=6661 RepID=A0AA88IB46_ARTSF|nr:hypothetical protein QYM36_002321 [Artemia franciscana]